MSETLPLLELLQELRRRGFALGVADYLHLLRTLDTIEIVSCADLRQVCQALSGKSREQQQIIGTLVDALGAAGQQKPRKEPARPGREKGGQPPPPAGTEPLPESEPEPTEVPHFVGFGPRPGDGGLAALDRPKTPDLDRLLTGRYDLTGDLPGARRHLNQAWRRVRLMSRFGPATLLDLDATLDRLARERVLVDVVRRRPRRNRAAVAVLLDVSPEMVPFRHLTQALLDAADDGGPERREVFYFRHVPDEPLFRRRALRGPVSVREALEPFRTGGVLLVGEAGAARGESRRGERLRAALRVLKKVVPRLAWVNPMPRSRWEGSDAASVAQEVRMFALDNWDDVRGAMDVIGGRSRG